MICDLRRAATPMAARPGFPWFVAAAVVLSVFVAALGVSLGTSIGVCLGPWIDPMWNDSASVLRTGLCSAIISLMSSAVRNYLAARVRTKGLGAFSHELLFQDSAHRFAAWALATILGAAALPAVTCQLANSLEGVVA